MTRNKMDDLRNHLFEVIELLKDNEIEVDRAKAVSDVAGRIIESAKVEVQYKAMLAKEGYSPVSDSPLLSKSRSKELEQGGDLKSPPV